MQKRKLGNLGPEASLVGLGANNFGGRIDLAASRLVVSKALDLGVTLIDTADAYGNRGGSEEVLGKILGPRRKDIVLATKFGLPMDEAGTRKGASRAYITQAIEASLRRLRTDWIDLYQVHSARSGHADRGDAAHARRFGAGRKGVPNRLLQFLGRAA